MRKVSDTYLFVRGRMVAPARGQENIYSHEDKNTVVRPYAAR